MVLHHKSVALLLIYHLPLNNIGTCSSININLQGSAVIQQNDPALNGLSEKAVLQQAVEHKHKQFIQ